MFDVCEHPSRSIIEHPSPLQCFHCWIRIVVAATAQITCKLQCAKVSAASAEEVAWVTCKVL